LILDGENIYLRLLQKSDVDDFCAWYSDGHVTRFIGMNTLSQDTAKTLFNWILTDQNGVYFSIIKKDEEKIIGYIFLARILKSHRIAREFGIVIGDKTFWGCGYGSEATKLILDYGFHHLKLHRIQLIVLDFNERALHLYRKLGFIEEGIQRETRIVDDKWHNVIMMSILEQDFLKQWGNTQ
jgi:RimJ/RimL family protein N-acetyltransferase